MKVVDFPVLLKNSQTENIMHVFDNKPLAEDFIKQHNLYSDSVRIILFETQFFDKWEKEFEKINQTIIIKSVTAVE